MFHYMSKAEFVMLVSLKVPSGGYHTYHLPHTVCTCSAQVVGGIQQFGVVFGNVVLGEGEAVLEASVYLRGGQRQSLW